MFHVAPVVMGLHCCVRNQGVLVLTGFGLQVRELFVMAREHAPSIIFMDEVDSIGSARMDNSGGSGDSEVQRTMLELLNQLDGFEATNKIKVSCTIFLPQARCDLGIHAAVAQQSSTHFRVRMCFGKNRATLLHVMLLVLI